MAFKENEDFARFLTMGAYATAAVSDDLGRHGHTIIELERYAKANKIWQTKVKRLRLADLLCIRCGRRFESKGKTKLELKLSHSPKDPRQWWAAMRQDDVFAFVRVAVTSDGPDAGQVAYVTRRALHAAEPSLREGVRKAIADGAEPDVSWPVTVPTQGGVVTEIVDKAIKVIKDDGRRQTYSARKWAAYYPVRAVDERYEAGDVLASCAKPADITCEGDVWDWPSDLYSPDEGDRFPAVKAARFRGSATMAEQLRMIMNNLNDDWRLRLEAAASLAPVDDAAVIYLIDRALDATARDGEPMEGVFALSELDSDAAVNALVKIAGARGKAATEVRAAAAWGLGLGAKPSPQLLVPLLGDEDDIVALHAGAAMPDDLSSTVVDALVEVVKIGTFRDATSAAHQLSRHGHSTALLRVIEGLTDDVRQVALLAVGDAPAADVEAALGSADPTVAATVRTLQAQRADWLRAPETEGGLDVLAKQRVRL